MRDLLNPGTKIDNILTESLRSKVYRFLLGVYLTTSSGCSTITDKRSTYMKLLFKALNWLNDHKPSIGFYIGTNPWDSSNKDAEIADLISERDNLKEVVAARERIILSLSMQKEELQRELMQK